MNVKDISCHFLNFRGSSDETVCKTFVECDVDKCCKLNRNEYLLANAASIKTKSSLPSFSKVKITILGWGSEMGVSGGIFFLII